MKFEISGGGEPYVLDVHENERGFHAQNGDDRRTFTLDHVAGDRHILTADGRRYEVDIVTTGEVVRVTCGADIVELQVRPHLPVHRQSGGVTAAQRVTAPMPGLVTDVRVQAGDAVTEDQAVIILEAMKMQMELRAPAAGVVRRVAAQAGAEVAGGALLVEIETLPAPD